MPRRIPGLSKRRQRLLAIGAIWVALALVAYLTQLTINNAAASAGTSSAPSSGEAAAGVLAVSESYPGGLPALLALFDSGECTGVESYQSAPPACRSVLDQIAQSGAGQPFPERIPALTGGVDGTVPPGQSPDPSDRITPEMLDEMEAQGAPADLIEGLRQNPPVIPPAYNTLPHYQGGPPSGTAESDSTVLPPSTSTTVPPPPPTTLPPPTTTTTLPPPTTTTPPPTTTTPPPTTTTTVPTTTTTQPPPPPPPLLVAVGDSVTSGHEARPGAWWWQPWRTTCDDPGVGPAAPGSSWAGNLRALLGVPWNRYFNFAHSGASTGNVLTTSPYTNPCGVVSQAARTQIADANAVLAANPSRAGAANVAVVTAGVNDTNWVAVATQLVARQLGGAVAGLFGFAPGWAVANPGACTDWVIGNPAGNATPGAPPGAIPPAWNGAAVSGAIAGGAAAISLNLISADPGAQVRHPLYYRWIGDPNLPPVCNPAAVTATTTMNGWIGVGILVAKIVWAFLGGNPNRIQAVCQQLWNPGAASIQTRLLSFGIANWAVVPGWPHPNAAGRGALAGCVNGTLPRAPGGGVA